MQLRLDLLLTWSGTRKVHWRVVHGDQGRQSKWRFRFAASTTALADQEQGGSANGVGVLGSLNTALIHHFFSVVLAVAVAFVFAFVGLIISGISIFFVSYFVRWFWKITYFL